jgi:paired small multidrug resistance pump
MTWIALVLAGFGEVLGVIGMTEVNRKRSFFAYMLLVAGFGLSFALLSYAMTEIAMGTAYAVWTGMGTVGSAVAGMVFYGEPRDRKRLFFISLIIVSVIGLRWME